jgi:glycosyltransferase involved in cell wall biosynthesis
MIKVLQFIHGLNMGGAETIVKNYALGLDKSKFDVTVLCFENWHSPYDELLKAAGIKVIYVENILPAWSSRFLCTRAINKMIRFIRIRRYIHSIHPDVIHEHLAVNSYLKFAKPKKPVVIFFTQHSSTQKWMKQYPDDIKAAKWLMKHYPVKVIALSDSMKCELQEVVEELYKNQVVVLNNGIELSQFQNAGNGQLVRREHAIPPDAFVVGHVGRFSQVKNHRFLVEIFAEILKKKENAFLLMVGKGELLKSIKDQLKELKLEDKALILSDRMDIPKLMHAMDVFVFPSFSEGFGIALIEAQFSGLHCVASDTIPKATRISNLIQYMNLDETAKSWADEILSWKKEKAEYYDPEKWDMCQIIHQLEDMYMEAVREAKEESK